MANRPELTVANAWPAPMALSDLGRTAVERRLEADEAARRRIAKALDIVELKSLSARLRIAPWLDGAEITGRWSAKIVQICGVTLEPFETELQGEVSVRTVPEGSPALGETPEHDIDLDPDAADPPEALEGEVLPLGAYVVEALSLSVDPFPRKPGVRFEAETSSPDSSPFSALIRLKDRERGG